MVIRVNSDYRIASNATCWQIERYHGRRKDGTARWEPLSYHVDFNSALVALAELRIRLIDTSVPDEIMAAIQAIKEEAFSTLDLFRESNG